MQGQFPFMFGQGGADQQDIARHVQEVGLDRAFAGLMADMMGVMSMAGGGITSSNSRHQQQDEGGVGSPEEERRWGRARRNGGPRAARVWQQLSPRSGWPGLGRLQLSARYATPHTANGPPVWAGPLFETHNCSEQPVPPAPPNSLTLLG